MRNGRNYGLPGARTEQILDLLFPRRCPLCDEPVPVSDDLICSGCERKMRYIEGARCRKCGKKLPDDTKIYCSDCQKRHHSFDYGYALYAYRDMHESIYRFKFKKRCEYARFYAQDIWTHLRNEVEQMNADALIPVPLHPSRRAMRGYNQSELVTRELARLCGVPSRADIVKRVRKTVPQKELDELGRQNNLKKAFLIRSDVVKLDRVIIVDDVYTTGSTMDAVASVLRQHGASKVFFITLCIGEGT